MSTHGSCRVIVPLALSLSLGLAACGGSSKPSSSNATTTTVNHRQTFAEGETSGIASQLTAVPGYRYVDPPASEVKHEIDVVQQQLADWGAPSDLIRAVSFHGVVADDSSQNTARTSEGGRETGFLQLREFSPPPPSDVDITQLGAENLHELGSFTVGDTEAVVFEDPTASADSRYVVIWLRHGVWSAIDGATRAALEKWVRAYLSLPERQPSENDELANALVKVASTAYANFWDDTSGAVATELFDGATASSIHSVVNAHGSLGTLLLATADKGVTQQSIDAVVTKEVAAPKPAVIGGHAVHKAEASGRYAYTWISNGIAHVLLSGYPDQAEAFLQKYFAG